MKNTINVAHKQLVGRPPDECYPDFPSLLRFLRNREVNTAVDDTAEVEIGGKRVPVCSLLQGTSYGVKVTVL